MSLAGENDSAKKVDRCKCNPIYIHPGEFTIENETKADPIRKLKTDLDYAYGRMTLFDVAEKLFNLLVFAIFFKM